jgi:uncharacterized membrane protein YdbT with pleckstrin-like domain
MSYAKSVLQPGETIVAMGRLHWIGYWPTALVLVLGIALISWLYAWQVTAGVIWFVAAVFGALFLYFFVRAAFDRWVTEIAVTNKRVIYKRGLISRRTTEMNIDKVETVDIDQPILGGILDYGTIQIVGTGGKGGVHVTETEDENEVKSRTTLTVASSGITVHPIASPFRLRNAITAK